MNAHLARLFAILVLSLSRAALSQVPIEADMKASDGVRIHYYTSGKGTPVVLVHGYTSSARGNWIDNGVMAALAKNHYVVALDCRNHGESDKPQPNGLGRAEDVIELMDHLKIAKAHIHGYSMGGWITGQLLAKHPDRFLSAAFGGSGIAEIDPQWLAKVPPDKEGRDPAEDQIARRLRIRHAMDNGMNRSEAEKVADRPAAPTTTGTNPALPRLTPVQIDLTRVDVPVLAINGEFDRPIAKTHRMWRELRNFTNVVLPGKSHMSAVASGFMPPSYVENLERFIDAHDTH
jgi:pimeloyl-ACP methyl ester carboxylesterase